MLDYLPIVWVAIIIFSIVSEMVSHTFIPLWFAPAALVSLVMSFFGLPEWLGVLVFVLVWLVLLLLSRTVLVSLLRIKKCSLDSFVGRQALVVEPIDNLRMKGKARIDGVEIAAVSCSNDIVIPAGEVVTITAYENGVVVCE